MKKFTSILEEKEYWGKEAAGVLPFCPKTKRFLVAFRSAFVMEPHTWGIFGGKLDDNEHDPKRLAKRQLVEETEYNGVIHLKPAYIYEDKNVGLRYHNFIGIVQDEFEAVLNWESEDTKWFTLEELRDLKNKHFGLVDLLHNSSDMFEELVK